MQHAGGRDHQQGVAREIRDRAEPAAGKREQEEHRHPDRHADRQRLGDRAGQDAATRHRVVQTEGGCREGSKDGSKHVVRTSGQAGWRARTLTKSAAQVKRVSCMEATKSGLFRLR
jgi:hypothetical protein